MLNIQNEYSKMNISCIGLPQVASNGTDDLKYLLYNDLHVVGFSISVLAQSASILISARDTLRGNHSIIFQLDYINNSTGDKEFKILYCLKIHGLSSASCFAVHTQKVDTKLLSVPFK
jgi:hypothetical protein